MSRWPLSLFAGYGVELEYMIVDRVGLDVLPVADRLLAAEAGEEVCELERDGLGWSNELALHVIELKTDGPAPALSGLAARFQAEVRHINRLLDPLGGRLMPGGMHPWMNPLTETRIWPHENGPIYQAYHRIFDCRGHGWSNLQSAHLNLPFASDEEFGRLHAAIRLLLPLMPALSAASPFMNGRWTGLLNSRLEVYRHNQKLVPEVAGEVVPEPAGSEEEYQRRILQPLYRAIAPLDPVGILRHEWLNSRGAIARFDRGAIEIRILDTQEHPAADLAIHWLIAAALRALVEERWCPYATQMTWPTEPLAHLLRETLQEAERTVIVDPAYLAMFGYNGRRTSAGGLWMHLAAQLGPPPDDLGRALHTLLDQGPLARRLSLALGSAPERPQLRDTYGQLCTCLDEGRPYVP